MASFNVHCIQIDDETSLQGKKKILNSDHGEVFVCLMRFFSFLKFIFYKRNIYINKILYDFFGTSFTQKKVDKRIERKKIQTDGQMDVMIWKSSKIL